MPAGSVLLINPSGLGGPRARRGAGRTLSATAHTSPPSELMITAMTDARLAAIQYPPFWR
jgi:hypothetical protein